MNIWIINHYAMPPEYEVRIRNNAMAKYLQKKGHEVKIIAASTIHNTNINLLENSKSKITEKTYGELNFVHIKASCYRGNGLKRIFNHFQFPIRFLLNYNKISNKPDVIICNLGIPFTIIPYIISRKISSKFIFEVRDLWPESIIEYKKLSRKNPFVKLMYIIEKWIYKKSDKIVFTMEGGRDYITDKGWDNEIDLSKVHHINNGVDLDSFNRNKEIYNINDDDLNNRETFKVVYAGSIRLVNNVKKIVEAAKFIQEKKYDKIQFLIYGDGSDRIPLEKFCKENNINNVKFKGHVEKKFIPYILSKSDVNILHFEQNALKKYGASLNKLFEYFASGKPTLSDCEFGYDLINRYKAGISQDIIKSKQMAQQIIKFFEMDKQQYNEYCINALKAANDYDYKSLANKFNSEIVNGGQDNE